MPTVLQKEINSIVVTARDMSVLTPEQLGLASKCLKICNERVKVINATFNPIVEKAHGTWKEALKQKNIHLKPVADAKDLINSKVSGYQIELEKVAAQKRAAAAEEARKKVEAEKAAEARQVEAEGFKEEAAAILEEERPITIVKEVVPAELKPQGLSYRHNWKIEVLDVRALIASNPEYVIPDQKALNQRVKSLKGKAHLPGCRVWNEKIPIQK